MQVPGSVEYKVPDAASNRSAPASSVESYVARNGKMPQGWQMGADWEPAAVGAQRSTVRANPCCSPPRNLPGYDCGHPGRKRMPL
jgi:hypothetical protein